MIGKRKDAAAAESGHEEVPWRGQPPERRNWNDCQRGHPCSAWCGPGSKGHVNRPLVTGNWTYGLLRSFPVLFLWFLSKFWGGCNKIKFPLSKMKDFYAWALLLHDYWFFLFCALFSLVKKHEVEGNMALQPSISSCSSSSGIGVSDGQTQNNAVSQQQFWQFGELACPRAKDSKS